MPAEASVKASCRCLSERCANLPFKVAARALDRLATAGLIAAVSPAQGGRQLRVDADALRRLPVTAAAGGVLIPASPDSITAKPVCRWTAPATAKSIGPSDPRTKP